MLLPTQLPAYLSNLIHEGSPLLGKTDDKGSSHTSQ